MLLVELLARDMNKWPGTSVFITQDASGHVYCWDVLPVWDGGEWMGKSWARVRIEFPLATDHATAIVTREMWEAERLRQDLARTDKGVQIATQQECSASSTLEPDWSKAPEGATHWVDSCVACWHKHVNGTCYYWSHQGEWVDLRQTESETIRDYGVDGVIPRPTTPQWRGPEDGLPPVGIVCEASNQDGKWEKVVILCHSEMTHGEKVVVFQCGDRITFSNPRYFRPIDQRTPREKWIEAAIIEREGAGGSLEGWMGRLYDRGLAKLPEDGE